MHISILGQGFDTENDNSVGNKLLELLEQGGFHTFTAISAFASETGVDILSERLTEASKFATVNIIVGVNQKATSKEALELINSLPVKGYVFYFGNSPIFHPKIYLFEGDEKAHLIIGSSNLTGAGLFRNVETSAYITLDDTESDLQTLKELKGYYNGLFEFDDPNLQPLNAELIAELVKDKIVPTEKERNKAYGELNSGKEKLGEVLSKLFPIRKSASIPSFRAKKKEIVKKGDFKKTENMKTFGNKGDLVWISGPLTERDLNIPKGSNTHGTGSMLFKKGLMKEIDQRHYFRDVVFSAIEWRTKPNTKYSYLERGPHTLKLLFGTKALAFGT